MQQRPHRRPRRLTGPDGRSQFCAGLLRLVLVSCTDAAGDGPVEGAAVAQGRTLERAVQQIARKGMRLMLLERTARQGWDRRRGR